MPRYYFHVRDRSGDLCDEEGRDLADLAAVRGAALEGARSLVCEDVMQGRLDLDGVMTVTDEAGRRVLVMTYRAAVGLEAEP